ncbi:MAG: PD-(D/E)XK nuclease-like domain-containing protein, partial [Candidatus Omnitrophica bacterium]|nr:PD-(D/E)XK nuclease-like domain-containing protein [Candidatus Omnitrophota bacterium]
LERHKIDECFLVFKKPYPEKNMNFQANKDAKAKLELENADKQMVEQKDYDNIIKMCDNIGTFVSSNLIESPESLIEHSFYAKIIFDRDGVFQKVENIQDFAELEANKKNKDFIIIPICTKPDCLRPDLGIDIDVKSCKSAHPSKFSKDAYSLGYHIQVAMGLDITSAVMGTSIDTFLFLALEKDPPYLGAIYDAADFIEYGQAVYRKRLLNIYRCAKKNFWPGYSLFSPAEADGTETNKPIPLWLPGYATPLDQIKF